MKPPSFSPKIIVKKVIKSPLWPQSSLCKGQFVSKAPGKTPPPPPMKTIINLNGVRDV